MGALRYHAPVRHTGGLPTAKRRVARAAAQAAGGERCPRQSINGSEPIEIYGWPNRVILITSKKTT